MSKSYLSLLVMGWSSVSFAHGLPTTFFNIRKPHCEVLLHAQADRLRLDLPRVSLRPARRSERPVVAEILRDPEIARYFMDGLTHRLDDAHRTFDRDFRPGLARVTATRLPSAARVARLLVEDRGDRTIFGLVRLVRDEGSGFWEIGVALDRDQRGRGFGFEIARGLIGFILALDPAAVIEVVNHAQNTAGHAFWDSVGFLPYAVGPRPGEEILRFDARPSAR